MEPFIGQIMMFGGNFAPRGWALCNGQLLAISSNTALFSIIGTQYGGDGRTTFGLPDLRGRMPISYGNGPGLSPVQIGQKGGAEVHTLSQAEMPTHNHSGVGLTGHLLANDDDGVDADPTNKNIGASENANLFNTSANNIQTGSTPNVAISGNTANAGGNLSFSIKNPYQAVNFVIALQGIFPSRN
ncbi:phage tail protein [Ascidiimonas sp. W6]|uniref:phage tail protein n=1 Tax=Ascidiimonas meishanensis TaxID=3128903 RepID=UPI0030EC6C1A